MMLPSLVALVTACGGAVGSPRPSRPDLRPHLDIDVEVLRRPEGLSAPSEPDEEARRILGPLPLPDPVPSRVAIPLEDAPGRGATAPLVTIVEYSDFQCPFCGRVQGTLRQVLEAHPEDVRLVFRHRPLPFHAHANLAAQGAVEAQSQGGDDAFWRMHDLLFERQRELNREVIARIGTESGVDGRQIDSALGDGRHAARVAAESAQAERVGASATPTFFLNGRLLRGAQPAEAFEAIVAEEIAFARRLIEAGVRREDLYERIVGPGLAVQ